VINRLFWIEDATVSEMDSFTADLPGSPTAVRTVTANTGQAVLTIDVPCSGTYVFFGLVWERFGSVAANQPDSFFVRVDDSDLVEWVYGCQTQAGDDSTWQWLRVAHRLASGCQIALVAAELEAGQHVMRIIGREGTQNLEDLDFSAIAAIAISNDPSYDPADDYDPYP
jgi:hypothetical protein